MPTLQGVASSGKEDALDEKQYIAYEVLCCSFLLNIVLNGAAGTGSSLDEYLSITLECECTAKKTELIMLLKAKGAQEQLIMLLSGAAGCGKSTSMKLAQTFCHKFCSFIGVPFSDVTFYFTSTTGSSAALFGGTTIHGAAHLNKKIITDDMRIEWRDVRILIIDEISFFKVSEMEKLDKNLKKLTQRTDLPFGGISIVFAGDFHQLTPVGKMKKSFILEMQAQ